MSPNKQQYWGNIMFSRNTSSKPVASDAHFWSLEWHSEKPIPHYCKRVDVCSGIGYPMCYLEATIIVPKNGTLSNMIDFLANCSRERGLMLLLWCSFYFRWWYNGSFMFLVATAHTDPVVSVHNHYEFKWNSELNCNWFDCKIGLAQLFSGSIFLSLLSLVWQSWISPSMSYR